MGRKIIAAALAIAASAGAHAAGPSILPGEWEVTSAMKMQTMPGMSPQVAAAIAKQQGKPMVMRNCITPEQAARGPESKPHDKNCKILKSGFAAGRAESEVVCTHDGQVTRMKMTGTYTPTSYAMDGAMSGSGGKAGPMAMTMHVTGKRISPVCSAKSQ